MKSLLITAIFLSLFVSCSSTEHLTFSKRLPPEVDTKYKEKPLEIKTISGDRGDELRMELISEFQKLGYEVHFSDKKNLEEKNILRGGVVYEIQLKEESQEESETVSETVNGVGRGNFTLVDADSNKVLWSDTIRASKSLGSYLTSQEEHPKFAVYTQLKDDFKKGLLEKFRGKVMHFDLPFIGAKSGEKLRDGYLWAKQGKHQKAIDFYKKQMQKELTDEEKSSLYINMTSTYILKNDKERATQMMGEVTTPEIYRSEMGKVRSALSRL